MKTTFNILGYKITEKETNGCLTNNLALSLVNRVDNSLYFIINDKIQSNICGPLYNEIEYLSRNITDSLVISIGNL